MRKGAIAAIRNTTLRRCALSLALPVLLAWYCWAYIFLIPWALLCGAVEGVRDELSRLWWSHDFRLFRAGMQWMWADDYHTNNDAALKRASDAVRL